MNYRYILIGILSLFAFKSFAQIGDLRNVWSVGFNGGVNMNTVRIEPGFKQGNLLGPTFGFTARHISEKYFAMICGVQAEVNFSQHGWKEDVEDLSYSYSRTMNYVEIPFMAHLAFGRERGMRFFINLGPQFGFLLNEDENKSFGDTPPEGVTTTEQYGKFADNKFDYGITGGGGLELRTRRVGSFIIEGRYYFGLGDFFNSTKKDYFANSAHQTIAIKFTYLFDLTK